MTNWREQIEAQIASLRDGNYIEWTDEQLANHLQALLDVAVAADRQETLLRPLDITIRDALDRLREVGDE